MTESASRPAIVTTTDMTIARFGRSMKRPEIMGSTAGARRLRHPPADHARLHPLCPFDDDGLALLQAAVDDKSLFDLAAGLDPALCYSVLLIDDEDVRTLSIALHRSDGHYRPALDLPGPDDNRDKLTRKQQMLGVGE